MRKGILIGSGVVVVAVVGALLAVTAARALNERSYTFMATQADGQPVAFDRCHAIHVQVNPIEAPAGWQDIVRKALADIERASGYVFVDDGTTGARSLPTSWEPGAAPPPVLIMWSDRLQVQQLGGDVVGFGGPVWLQTSDPQRVYASGEVALDEDFTSPSPRVSDQLARTMVLEHELGHVLGLGHTTNPSQIMYATYHGQTHLGRGDSAGLRRLHDVPCR